MTNFFSLSLPLTSVSIFWKLGSLSYCYFFIFTVHCQWGYTSQSCKLPFCPLVFLSVSSIGNHTYSIYTPGNHSITRFYPQPQSNNFLEFLSREVLLNPVDHMHQWTCLFSSCHRGVPQLGAVRVEEKLYLLPENSAEGQQLQAKGKRGAKRCWEGCGDWVGEILKQMPRFAGWVMDGTFQVEVLGKDTIWRYLSSFWSCISWCLCGTLTASVTMILDCFPHSKALTLFNFPEVLSVPENIACHGLTSHLRELMAFGKCPPR